MNSSARRTPPNFFAEADDWLTRGYYLAGYVAYEAGYGFVEVDDPPHCDYPPAVLGVYAEPRLFDHLTGQPSAPLPLRPRQEQATPAGDLSFGLDFDSYTRRVERILEYLRAGDCYQINFTDAFDLGLPGDLHALYRRLKRVQPTSYGAYLNLGHPTIASFSPELHFRVRGNELLTRPMKGTARRGRTLAEDAERRAELAADEKNRAENVMIVDLLRNDVGRLCRFGSVSVPELFDVEPFGSVLQMTSTVRGDLRESPRLGHLFSKLFPSGSVTGAPKRRAMEIIRELENRPRGVYTGAIGYASPAGDMAFSVAIRTLVQATGPNEVGPSRGVFGVGSGIVIDSSAEQEYRECLLKGEFITSSRESFELLETMRFETGIIRNVERHLDRLGESAAYFGYPFDRTEAVRLLAEQVQELGSAGIYRLRLSLGHDGLLGLAATTLAETTPNLPVGLADERVDSDDPFLYHKTTLRRRQERAMTVARRFGLSDMLFLNERGELTEGAVSNLFVERGGRLLTPPVTSGLLPGVGRAVALESLINAEEAVLRPGDLMDAEAVFLCSSLRGMRLVEPSREWFTARL